MPNLRTLFLRAAAKPGKGLFAAIRESRLARSHSGIAAVEFALILPVLLSLYFGITEIGDAVVVYSKVTNTASSVGDLVTQAKNITNSDMTNIFAAASAIITPYPAANLSIVLTAVQTDAASKATVAWSDALHGTALAKNASFTLPASILAPSIFVVDAEVTYTYKPIIGYLFSGSFPLSRQSYLLPRNSSTITRGP